MSHSTPQNQHAKADGLRLAIVASSFNGKEVMGLLQGAERALKESASQECTLVRCGASWDESYDKNKQWPEHEMKKSKRYMVYTVPGALELPLAAKWLAEADAKKRPDAIVALGVVLRGETPHFDYVSSSCLQGLLEVSLRTGVPVTCGVLTVNDEAQAKERSSDNDENNRGYSAMQAAIEMAALRKLIH